MPFTGPIFPDILHKHLLRMSSTAISNEDESEFEQDVSEGVAMVFFELANVPEIAYRLSSTNDSTVTSDNTNYDDMIILQQDLSNHNHTGGIVWETSFLLLQYLLETKTRLGTTVVEVGAGLGLLSLVLAAKQCQRRQAHQNSHFIATDTEPVVNDLYINVERNKDLILKKNTNTQESSGLAITVCSLDWRHCNRDIMAHDSCADKGAALLSHSADVILGTDVVFAPLLVQPLLETCHRLSHDNTIIYFCLQKRCVASYQMLLKLAPLKQYGAWQIEDLTINDELWKNVPACAWGKELDCHLLRWEKKKVGAK